MSAGPECSTYRHAHSRTNHAGHGKHPVLLHPFTACMFDCQSANSKAEPKRDCSRIHRATPQSEHQGLDCVAPMASLVCLCHSDNCPCAPELEELAADSLQLLTQALADFALLYPALFSLQVYGSIIGMFELNNLGKCLS